MRLTRVHVDGALTSETHQSIRGTAANHIVRVLRLRAGDSLTVFDGRGGEYDATITEFGKDAVHITVNEHRQIERESPLSITLAQGVSRGERMDWVVQKATELGVTRIVPVLTERCVVRLDAKQSESKVRHWRAIVIAACEQCGRNHVPEVATPLSFDAYLNMQKGTQSERVHQILLSPTGEIRIRDLRPPGGAASVLIGPEGGLTELEHELAQRAGFIPVRLGPRVLRTETAAIAALTAIQMQLGDL